MLLQCGMSRAKGRRAIGRSLALIVAVLMAFAPVRAQTPAAGKRRVCVRKGKALKFALVQSWKPISAKTGDDIPLRLVRPLVVDGITLIPEGTLVHAKIAKKWWGEDGPYLDMQLKRIQMSDGSQANVKIESISSRADDPAQDHFDGGPTIDMHESLGFKIFETMITPIEVPAEAFPHVVMMLSPVRHEKYENNLIYPEKSTVAVYMTKDHWVRVPN